MTEPPAPVEPSDAGEPAGPPAGGPAYSVVSGTTVRFASLVVAILGASIWAFSVLYLTVPSNIAAGTVTYARCEELRQRLVPPPDLDLVAQAEAEQQARRVLGQCRSPFERTEAGWLVAGVGLLLVVAAGLFLVNPWWIRRRQRLVPLSPSTLPELHAALVELSTVAGLRRVPTFVLDPLAATPGGVTFGRFGRYTVRINAGLVPWRRADPELFRSVVLHELAHIRNRDVDLGYATMALWRAFVALALVPFLIVTVHPAILTNTWSVPWRAPNYGPFALSGWLRALLFVAVVYLIRNAVLRARELHADARAAEFGAAAGLRRAVSGPGDRLLTERATWRRRPGVHPDAVTRRRAIDDPPSVLRPGVGELFGAGLTTALVASPLVFLASIALLDDGGSAAPAIAWLVAPLAIGMLAAAAWRSEVLSAVRGRRDSVLPAAVAFGLGWVLGDLLSFNNGVTLFGVLGGADIRLPYAGVATEGGLSLSAGLIGAAVLVAGMAGQAAVSAAGARTWLPVLRGRNTRLAWAASVVVTAVPFGLWYGVWSVLRSAPSAMAHLYATSTVDLDRLGITIWPGPGLTTLLTVYPPLTLFSTMALAIPAVVLAWLYPLSARLRRPRPALDWRSALRVGLVGAGGFAILALLLRVVLHLSVGTPEAGTYLYFAVVGLAVAGQGLVAGVIVARARPLGVVLGQFAATVMALLATAAIVGLRTLDGCLPLLRLQDGSCHLAYDGGYTLGVLRRVLIEGALAAIVVSTLVVVVGLVADRLPSRHPRVRRAALGGGVIVLLLAGFVVAGTTYASGVLDANVLARPAASPSEPGPSPIAQAGGDRVLTDAEVEAVARTIGVGLPSYWAETPPSPNGTTIDPPACKAHANQTFIGAIDADQRAQAHVEFSNGGRLASTTITADVLSYAIPVPASVFATAEADRAACPTFTGTLPSGFQVRYTVARGTAPPVGDQALRVDWTLAVDGQTNGMAAIVIVRIGHTLVVIATVAVNEPFDEALLQGAVSRVTTALA